MLIVDQLGVFSYEKCRGSPRTWQTHLQENNQCQASAALNTI